jgi:hypothetical protein
VKREIQRIEPFSAVRVGFFFGLLFGFFFGLFNAAIVRFLAVSYGEAFLPPGSSGLADLSGLTLLIFAVFTALTFSLLYALLGLVMAWFYNLIARLFGGIEVHTQPDEPAPGSRAKAVHVDDEEQLHV